MSRVEHWTGKPRVVEMMLWDGTQEASKAISQWVGVDENGDTNWIPPEPASPAQVWNTQEHCWVSCPVGHRVAKGRLGEFYPISPAAIEAGYVPADEVAL